MIVKDHNNARAQSAFDIPGRSMGNNLMMLDIHWEQSGECETPRQLKPDKNAKRVRLVAC